MARVDIHLGDIRQFVKEVETTSRELREIILTIIQEETTRAVKALKSLASGEAVTRRTGGLERAADANVVASPFTFDVELGFLKASDERTAAASYTLTGNAKMPITPVHAAKLAYPVRGVSPSDIIRSNTRGISVAVARQKYYLIYTDNAIMGRKLNSKIRKLYFLFARSDEVTVPKYIDLDKQADILIDNINKRMESEIGASYGE